VGALRAPHSRRDSQDPAHRHARRIGTDEILYDAALRNLQTLSEATQRLPDDVKLSHPAIPWKEISGFRNILVHDYLGSIDPAVIKRVIEQSVPELEAAIRKTLGRE